MSRRSLKMLALAVCSLGLTLAASGQLVAADPASTATNARATGSSLAHADAKFMREAAAGGLAEVELGKLAQEKGASDEVKQFGAKMAQDHAKANDALKPIAESKNFMLPNKLDSKDQRLVDKLQKLSGAKFDREYMKHMVSDHKKDLKAFEKEAKKGKDDDLKGFADKTLPTLREHLQLAQNTEGAVKGEGKRR